MMIFSGSRSQKIAEKITQILNFEQGKISITKWPDGETYVRVDSNVEGKDVLFVETMFPNQNEAFMEISLSAEAILARGAKEVTAFIPYLAYSRMDKRFQTGDALSIKAIVKFFKAIGINKLITVDTHYQHVPVGKFDLFGLDCLNLSAGKILFEHVKENFGEDLLVIGPDLGSSEMIKYATGEAKAMDKIKICPICRSDIDLCKCEKKERTYVHTDIKTDYNFKDRNVLILDDMIATGGTMLKVIEKVRSEGAKKVALAATHGLFLKDSFEKLKNSSDYLVVTDSIETPVSHVSVSSLLKKFL